MAEEGKALPELRAFTKMDFLSATSASMKQLRALSKDIINVFLELSSPPLLVAFFQRLLLAF